jgi:hypothetical protein
VDVPEAMSQGVKCLKPEFIADYLIQVGGTITKAHNCLIKGYYVEGNMCLAALKAVYSAFRKYSHPLTFSTFCYLMNLKWLQLRFFVTDLHTIPHNVNVELFL